MGPACRLSLSLSTTILLKEFHSTDGITSTFYQMSTKYSANITQSVGLYTSGGGAAGLAGALTYTVLTQLGASPSAVISGTGFVPLVILTIYNFWLPGFPKVAQKEEKKPGARKEGMIKDLGTRAKLSIAKPIVKKYMLPLCTIFLVELINVQVRRKHGNTGRYSSC